MNFYKIDYFSRCYQTPLCVADVYFFFLISDFVVRETKQPEGKVKSAIMQLLNTEENEGQKLV